MTDLANKFVKTRRLTNQEKEQFQQWGYVKNLPVFDSAALPKLQEGFQEMVALLPPDVHMSRVNNWHKANRWVYELCRTPTILDYIEDVLGLQFLSVGRALLCQISGR